jgi:tripartite-type tricarboxylate transporter receptor subunit TctC
VAATARAQAWPAKPIQLIVPFPPGGGSDTFARPLSAKLTVQLGQQVVIDNRAGAAGTIGAAAVAKAPPDGYTLLLGAVHHTVAANVYKALPYDLERDLMPITGVAYVPDVLVMNPGVPAAALGEFIAYCKANPGKVNYGSSGVGTSRHLAGEIFNAMTGAAMVHVPYKGSGPANAALLAGEISVIFEGLGSSAPYLQSGKFRALGLAAAKRSPAFPDTQPWPKPDCRALNRCPGTACGRRPARRAIFQPASRRKSRGPSRRRT